MRYSFRFVLALLVIPGVWFVHTQPARAAQYQCGTTTNYQVGWSTVNGSEPKGAEGSSSYIYNEPVAVCGTDNRKGFNFSTSWNMVQATANGYAQSGYMYRYGDSCTQMWAEQFVNGSFTDWNAGCAAMGSRHAFRNLMILVNGSYRTQSSYDGHNIHTTTYDPFSEWTGPFHITFNSETYHLASDVAGDTDHRTAFTSMGVQLLNDSVVTTCGNVVLKTGGANSRYSADALDCNYTENWTK